ncbi:hypothetical protein NY2A_b019R [Paramecium bursaria Chlorella virus NY2A]|uniref:Uncharacterized protein b019R n=1 Tax=Paramecium bursaria Chlorella virus NY2A TaxID=46021 RepID=A7IVP4_PBCVN|nr:hypothetical protein NY2A_b019R [Paramecium bursaria Chlorella virus NY2A]ABT14418.1 hypothetical protein NY2A_b019R [Paramecium bursaria Chlorella virus NY2A]
MSFAASERPSLCNTNRSSEPSIFPSVSSFHSSSRSRRVYNVYNNKARMHHFLSILKAICSAVDPLLLSMASRSTISLRIISRHDL